jgi:signal transduction histidine kinase
VNRTLERWKLGRVTEVHGKDAHSLLHPKCKQSPCPLKRILEAAWQRVAELQGRYFKVTDAQLKRTLRVALQPMAVEGQLSTSGDSFAVLVVADFTELHQAQKELRVLNEQLEARVRERTEQLQDRNRSLRDQIARAEVAENEVQLSRDELARLSEQLMQTQETERRRIAIELHDAVGSSLGAVKYSLERASEMTRFPELGDPAEVLAQSIERVQHAIDEARSIAMNLRPSLLDDMGVVSAVNWYCRQFGETYVDLHIIADCQITDAEVPERLATPIFRIVQEALNNVVKHARARNALVFLGGAGQKLVLEVRDDGVGFDKSSTRAGGSTGLGIVGMRERASITGGKFSLISGEDVSTRVRVEWALSESDLARGG